MLLLLPHAAVDLLKVDLADYSFCYLNQLVQVQLQLIQERVQQALQEQNQAFLESMQEELARAVTDVVAEGGFDLILNVDSAPYFAPVLDITARVTAKLNENAQNEASED